MTSLMPSGLGSEIQHSLAALRDFFLSERILISFNAPVSRPLIKEVGLALREHIQTTAEGTPTAIDVFSVYIEMSQNISNYVANQAYGDKESVATVVIAETEDGRYLVSAGNVIDPVDGAELVNRVNYLSSLDPGELKSLYKQQLREPRHDLPGRGAGLGLIQIARKATGDLRCGLGSLVDGRTFFVISAKI